MNTAIVTGAAQGLGLVTARRLAAAGYRVVLTDMQDVSAQAASISGAAIGISGDVSSEAFVEDMAGRIAKDFGGAQVLVNNAGISLIQPAEDTTLDQWQKMMAVNLQGPFLLCRAFGRQMLSAGKGSIVNVASVAGLGGVIHRSAYNTSKHGLIGLTRTLAGEWGGRGVRVNAVCPGWIKTEMDVKDMGSGAYDDTDIINRVPMARFAMPEDVAEGIAFLASDAASFINGVSLPVDGGWTGDISWDSLRLKTRG
jgi:NAD(P)-dependent dehydrogenase (short-subunit alcohol dehydrogenase family)